MSAIAYPAAPRAIDVLPMRVTRRLTRRDGLLPLVFTLELLAGMAFGIAGNAGQTTATSVPAQLMLAPVAQVTVLPSTAPVVGPAVGPLRPGTVRPPVVESVTVVPARPKHAPRNPFGPLARPR